MIVNDNYGREYLDDLRKGNIPLGLGIGNILDNHLRFKKGQLVMINGHDNVGKTFWIVWYFLALTIKHQITWTIYSSENQIAKVKRDLIMFKTGKKLDELSDSEFYQAFNEISHYFKFVDIEELYTPTKLLECFKQSDTDGYLIDPLTSLLSEDIKINKHETDNEVVLKIKSWLKKNNKTLYINTHVSTEAARRQHPKDHDLAGHLTAPHKPDTIGGQKFADRADDFITIHRYTQHERLWSTTEIHVRKVKDTLSGGRTTLMEHPVKFKLQFSCIFECGGVNSFDEEYDTTPNFDAPF